MQSHVNFKKDKMGNTVVKKKAEDVEPELRPEFIKKIKRMEKDSKKPIKYEF